jgi:hypothetical protein
MSSSIGHHPGMSAVSKWLDPLRPPWRVARRLLVAAILTPKDAIVSTLLKRDPSAPQWNVAQFWDRAPPDEIVRAMDTWQTGICSRWFGYLRFDEDSAWNFMRQNFDERTLRAFGRCAVPAMKADFFRYCFLQICGGVWIDADLSCVGNPYPLLFRARRGILSSLTDRRSGHIRLLSDVMMVRNSGDALMAALVELCVRNIERRTSNSVNAVTGPAAMTALMREQPSLFSGYQILPRWRIALRYVRGIPNPAYKSTDRHWPRWERERSIFVDDV